MADTGRDEFGQHDGDGDGERDATVGGSESLYDRRLSGQKEPPDPALIAAAVRRPPHVQRIEQQDYATRRFESAQFVGHVSDKITFNKNGDFVLTILVPFEFKQFAIPLSDAFGIPLSFDVQVWKPYSAAVASDE